ncbi:MAG: meta-pathway of phenol degradation [Desulfobacteraceae bacterium]|nr:MAG: meta-pathway of phenol degradation [Desulfobacteraceae bacterium]
MRSEIRSKFLAAMLIFLSSTLAGLFNPETALLHAADHYNLEEGLPVTIEDALPTAYRNREVQGLVRWDHTKEGEEHFRLEPRFEFGLWRNLEAEVTVPFNYGSAVDDKGIGDVEVSALYNFNQETLLFPALSLSGAAIFPTSDEGEGVDTRAKFIATKAIGRSSKFHRLHLNVVWNHNTDALHDERDDYYSAIIGYDRAITADAFLVLDIVREQQKEKDQTYNLLEAGIRYQCNPLTVFTFGVGTGIGDDSPDFRAVVGFQRSLTF